MKLSHLPRATARAFKSIMLSVALLMVGSAAAVAAPMYSFDFSIAGNAGYGTLEVDDIGAGSYWATSGNMVITAGIGVGTYALNPIGPAPEYTGRFTVDNVIYPGADPVLDVYGLSFSGSGMEFNLFGIDPGMWVFAYYQDGDANNTNVVSVRGDFFDVAAIPGQVPEPGSMAMLALGLGLMAYRRRCQR